MLTTLTPPRAKVFQTFWQKIQRILIALQRKSLRMEGGDKTQWFAHLLPDPAALSLITGLLTALRVREKWM